MPRQERRCVRSMPSRRWGVELGFKHSAGRSPNWKAGLKGKQLRKPFWSPIISPTWTLKRSDPRRVEHLKIKVTTFTNDIYLSRMKIAKSYCIILAVAKDYWPKSIQKKLMLGISSKIWGPKLAIKIFDVLHFFWSGGPQQNVVHLFGLQSGGRCRVEVSHSLTEADRCCIAIIASSTLQKQGVAKRTMIWMCFLEFAD